MWTVGYPLLGARAVHPPRGRIGQHHTRLRRSQRYSQSTRRGFNVLQQVISVRSALGDRIGPAGTPNQSQLETCRWTPRRREDWPTRSLELHSLVKCSPTSLLRRPVEAKLAWLDKIELGREYLTGRQGPAAIRRCYSRRLVHGGLLARLRRSNKLPPPLRTNNRAPKKALLSIEQEDEEPHPSTYRTINPS